MDRVRFTPGIFVALFLKKETFGELLVWNLFASLNFLDKMLPFFVSLFETVMMVKMLKVINLLMWQGKIRNKYTQKKKARENRLRVKAEICSISSIKYSYYVNC